MKIYVQNGATKKVVSSPNYLEAAKKILKDLVKIQEDGTEKCELAPTTLVSDFGFVEDIIAMEDQKQIENQIKRVGVYLTSQVFDRMGRPDVAKFIRQHEKNLPTDVKRKLKITKG